MESKQSFRLIAALAVTVLAAPAFGPSAAAQIAPAGEELTVLGDRAGRATAPAVAFGGGQALVVWEAEGRGVVGRSLGTSDGATGPELELASSDLPDRVPFSGNATLQRDPSVVALDDGGFLAVWVEERQHVVMDIFYFDSEVLDRRVVVQRFDAAGAPAGPRSALGDGDLGFEGSPRVARLSDGRFLAVWETASEAGADTGIYGRLLNRRGVPVRSAFRVDSPAEPGSRPALVALDNHRFLVVWQGCCDGDGAGVFARRFLARGEPLGEAFRVNTTEAGDQLWPAVARAGSGGLLVAWMGLGDAASELEQRVYGQVLETDGSPVGGELALSHGEARAHGAPTLTGTGSGYLVAWTVWGRHFPSAVHGAELDEQGAPVGGVLGLSTGPVNTQWRLALSGDDGQGRYLAAWEGFDSDGNRSINGRLLQTEIEPGNRSVGIATASRN